MNWWQEKSPWNDERIAQLKALWAAGLSAAQIADELGLGISRNAVLGKVHRLRLKLALTRSPNLKKRAPREQLRVDPMPTVAVRSKAKSRTKAGKCAKLPKLPRQALPKEPAIAVEPLHIAFADLAPSHCRWPLGDGPFTFCGHRRLPDSSYCAHHEAIAWRDGAAKPKRRGGFILPDFRKTRAAKRRARKAA